MNAKAWSERTTRGAWLCLGVAVGALGMMLVKAENRREAAIADREIAPLSARIDIQDAEPNQGTKPQEGVRPQKQTDEDDGPKHRRGGRLNIVPGPNVLNPATQPMERGPGGPGGGGLGPRHMGDVIERCLEVAQDIDPAMARRLRALREREPEEFEHTVRQVGRRLMILADLKVRDGDLYRARIGELQTEAQITRIANDLCAARSSQKTAEVTQLEQLLKNQLMVQLTYSIKARTEYLSRLREQVAKVECDINDDAAAFSSIVEERYQAILSRPPCDSLDMLKDPRHPDDDRSDDADEQN